MGVYQRRIDTRRRAVARSAVSFVVGTAFAVAVVSGGPSPAWIVLMLLWWSGLIWVVHSWLGVTLRVEVDRSDLRWESALRSGSIPIADITAVGPGPGVFRSTAPVTIEHPHGRPVEVMPAPGIVELVRAIALLRPDLALRSDWWDGHRDHWRDSPSAWHPAPP